MFVSGEVIMYRMEWLQNEEQVTDFYAQKRHSGRFMETCFLSWDYSDDVIKLDCSFSSSSEHKNS